MPGGVSIPRLRPGVKFRFDARRDAWVLLAPERLFVPDDIAAEVLKRVDGVRTTEAIIDELSQTFAAPRDLIAGDVVTLLQDLSDKGAVSL